MRISDWSSDVCSSDLAVNDYLARNERFVERERAFIDSSSHELRTPVAVIAGASELALDQPGTPDAVRNQLSRILRTARGVEQLLSLLLVLAKDPQRLAQVSDQFRLRSEEHTPELQSLMRISYAVFCLKKKRQITNTIS